MSEAGSLNPFPSVLLVEGTTPTTPAAGKQRVYARSSDGKFCRVNSSGTVFQIEQDCFKTIAVSGQSDVVADSTTDTLTLAAGSNITITTNASTDTITIAASGGGVSDGDKGDVTVSSSGATWTIDNSVVTLAKIANAAASSKLLGSGASGSGSAYAELTLGTNLSMSGTTLNAAGASVSDGDKGDVTVGASGATWTIDNSAVTLAKIANASASSKLLGSGASGSGSAYAELTLGTNLSMSGTTLNASAGVSGSVVQVKNTQTGTLATGTTVIPIDNTIPQNTEGDEYMTLAVTPTSSTNKLKIEVVVYGAPDAGIWCIAALFQDSTANALAAGTQYQGTNGGGTVITFTYYMTAGTTSSTTFKVRAGTSSGSRFSFNGGTGNQFFGGVMASSITITEIVP